MKIKRLLKDRSLYVSLFAFCLTALTFSFPVISGLTQKLSDETVESSPARAERKNIVRDSSASKSIFAAAVVSPGGAIINAGDLIISEFRWRGPNGANDEFVEIYNNTDLPITVAASDASAGYSLAASNGVARFTIPNGTVIPARGHFLGCNSVGYSLAAYPAGNGTTATCDATYTTDIPDNAGLALFRTATAANFTLTNRLDAVGSSSEANTLYKEGTGVRNLITYSIDYSYYRRPSGGCLGTSTGTVDANCTTLSSVVLTPAPGSSNSPDTNDNRTDFFFTDTNGTSASSEGTQQRLAAPGPENLSSPIATDSRGIANSPVDSGVLDMQAPNFVRNYTSEPANNATFGTITLRRKFTNNTGTTLTRLRFRVLDITTFPAASGVSDLRPITSTATVVTISAAGGGGNVTVQGTSLEQPPSQPNGGGYNSTLSAGTVTLATPLAPGASVDVQFLLGLQQTGAFRFAVVAEGLPTGGGIFSISCASDAGSTSCQVNNSLVFTAANASVGGRVTRASGRGVANVNITLTDTNGNKRETRTNPFGYYRFNDVPAGASYVVSAKTRNLSLNQSSKAINVGEDITDIDFIGNQ
jgi:hypothetical protein